MAAGASGRKEWLPLESNPDVINRYLEKLGFPVTLLAATDVMSTEEWALEMVPRPVAAVLMVYPIKEVQEEHRKAEEARIAAEGQVVAPNAFFLKQYIGNACGTIGIIHAAANLSTLTGGDVPMAEGSFLESFVKKTLEMTPEKRAEELEKDDAIEAEQAAAVAEGQSDVEAQAETNAHFVAFVEKEGHLYLMDGRRSGPINLGPSSRATLLEDAVAVIKEYMARDPEELRFTLVALAPPQEE